MEITIQINDKVYQRLMAVGGRVQGTIGLVSPTAGNFNEHARRREASGGMYKKLRHGRVSVNERRVNLTLRVRLDEDRILPAEAIEVESRQAGAFVDDCLEHIERYH